MSISLLHEIEKKGIRTVILDLDGNLRSGPLILAEGARYYFTKRDANDALLRLFELGRNAKYQPFAHTMADFSHIVEGVNVKEFNEHCSSAVQQNFFYPAFKPVFKIFRDNGLKIFLTTLSTAYVAGLYNYYFRFDGVSSFPYPTRNGRFCAMSRDHPLLSDLDNYKLKQAKSLGWLKDPFLGIGGGSPDYRMLQEASIGLALNPTTAVGFSNIRRIIRTTEDPWIIIEHMLLHDFK